MKFLQFTGFICVLNAFFLIEVLNIQHLHELFTELLLVSIFFLSTQTTPVGLSFLTAGGYHWEQKFCDRLKFLVSGLMNPQGQGTKGSLS